MLNHEEAFRERVRAANIPAMCFGHLLDAAKKKKKKTAKQ